MTHWALVVLFCLMTISPVDAADGLKPYVVRGDAIKDSLTGSPGDPARGREIVSDRQHSLCLLCHTGPFDNPHMQGNLAPDLRGSGTRLSPAQLRLRLVDMRRLSPDTVMPSFYRIEGLTMVAAPWQGRPILTGEEIEDVVAYLVTLKDQ